MRRVANHLPRRQIMTETVVFQKEFALVDRPSSPVVSDAADGCEGSGQLPMEDVSWIGAIAPTM
jgi:hypothetical protein